MDKAMMALSILDKEEDTPFIMPDLPEYGSCERNALSIIGRLLNTPLQSMKNLILDMPRKWQKYGRVRGISLSQEKFQFIFRSEHDLNEVLEKGAHAYNKWSLAWERWVEFPPPDYLQYVYVWVQIKNIPANYYIVPAITVLGEIIGKVEEVTMDSSRARRNDFIRVKIRFDVAKPLRHSKVITLNGGIQHIIHLYYERIQKRCYNCQRLTHEKTDCPILSKIEQDRAKLKSIGIPETSQQAPLRLEESDPLYAILSEEQFGKYDAV